MPAVTLTHRRPPRRRRLLQALALASAAGAGAGLPAWAQTAAPARQQVRFGTLERLDDVTSAHVDRRPVEVWLPPGYDGRTPHAVLYMHDGQMLFDASTTWNRQAWAVDQVAAPMLARGELQPFIVVAPWNNGRHRFAEYFPQAWFASLDDDWRQRLADRALAGPLRGDAYLRYLVQELKPLVDARYATRAGRESTFLAGSSMGGLISLYGLCEYPEVFGGAACISTHWIGGFERNRVVPAAALRYLEQRLPDPARVRLWMDRGTLELDALYDEAQAQVDALMARRGFAPPRFRSVVHEGGGHNERDWQRQLPGPLRHLLAA